MAVNTLMTGMIVFRILKVTGSGAMHSTSVERTLGSTRGNKFRHIMFIVIESGMVLFAIQAVRVLLVFMPVSVEQDLLLTAGNDIVVIINQMLNVIIIFCSFHFFLLITLTCNWLGHHTNDNFGAGSNEVVLR